MFYTLDGILEIDLFKAQAAARTKLSEQGQIRGNDRGYLCIAAGSLSVHHHDYRLAGGRNLNRACDDAVRNDIDAVNALDRRTVELYAHSVGVAGDGISFGIKDIFALVGEIIILRAGYNMDGDCAVFLFLGLENSGSHAVEITLRISERQNIAGFQLSALEATDFAFKIR